MPKQSKKMITPLKQPKEIYLTETALLYNSKTKKIDVLVRIGKSQDTNQDIYIKNKGYLKPC